MGILVFELSHLLLDPCICRYTCHVHVMYMYMYIYTIYMYMYIYICTYVCIYIYISIILDHDISLDGCIRKRCAHNNAMYTVYTKLYSYYT